ncbi:MAG: hypothetical protein JWM09_18 [Francisellaceae bacterium]|nr:hypothetical protein [Francisellaceae bacterium]
MPISVLRFRAHHFLCNLSFKGKGYSPSFVKNFQKIHDSLNSEKGEQILIEVTKGLDNICKPCPNRAGKLCSQQAQIESLDNKHAEVLELKEGDVISWAYAKHLLKNKMTLEKFEYACKDCNWKKLGLCEQSLIKLHSS